MHELGKIKRIIRIPKPQPKPAAIPEPPPAEEEPIPAPSIFYPKPSKVPSRQTERIQP